VSAGVQREADDLLVGDQIAEAVAQLLDLGVRVPVTTQEPGLHAVLLIDPLRLGLRLAAYRLRRGDRER
jgi:hypothetical protein